MPGKSEKNKLLALSLAVGTAAGVAAVILHEIINLIQGIPISGNPARSLLPALGMLISLLIVRFIVRDNIGHGVTKVLQAVSRNESKIKPHNMWSSVLTSAVTIGFGGSVGAEAPIVYTGAAIGSNFGRWAGLSYKSITILVGCGAAGAIAGIFKAPLAGVLFTLEILLFNISMTSMMPLLLATVSATVVTCLFQGVGPSFECSLEAFKMQNIPFYIILGMFCALVSLYFTRSTLKLEDRLQKFKNPWIKWALCSMGVCLMVFLFPPLFGEGYNSVEMLLNGHAYEAVGHNPLDFLLNTTWGVPLFFALIMLLKVLSMTLTNAGGGVGGTFGPTLFVGAIAGFVLARTANMIMSRSGICLPEQNFVLVGMAGMMAAVMQAPMTAIFLIAEITGGYELFLPLIITATISFCVTRIWEKYSIYTKRIAQSGELLTHDSDQAVITLLHTSDLIRDKYPRISPESTLGEILDTVSGSTAAIFPVVDGNGTFQGVLDMDDLRKYMFNTERYGLKVYNIMTQPPATVGENEPMDSVVKKFEDTESWRLPVLTEERKYVGFISKSRILMAYREELKAISSQD